MEQLRILAIGDFHNSAELGDAAIHETKKEGGDKYDLFLALGDYYDREYYQRLVDNIDDNVKTLAITGNRDFNFNPPDNDEYSKLFNYAKVDFEDYKIVLLGTKFPPGFQSDIDRWIGDHDPKKLIFASHVPPRMLRDHTDTGVHPGFPKFKQLILKYKPALWLCGHIHEAYGTEKLLDTRVINASAYDSGKGYSVTLKDGVESIEPVELKRE